MSAIFLFQICCPYNPYIRCILLNNSKYFAVECSPVLTFILPRRDIGYDRDEIVKFSALSQARKIPTTKKLVNALLTNKICT